MTLVEVTRGDGPLVLGLPHTGTLLPDDTGERLNARGSELADTDWQIHDLYADLVPEVTTVRTRVHRYAIDVNRDPSGDSLYPGQNTTGLVPLTDFDGQPIWRDGMDPDAETIAARLAAYHVPYHQALEAEIARVKARHGHAVLYDCHSIRSHIPFLFPGTLPDFNIGTNEGETCAPAIETGVADICKAASTYSTVLNGRFKGGWTTRHYGRPNEGLHAIQMELAQSTYLRDEAAPWEIDPAKARSLRQVLTEILHFLAQWRPA